MKTTREFYNRSALNAAKDFLGKELVHDSPHGRLSLLITDVEAYPAFHDGVSHANKRTKRTEVIWGPPGYAYVYVIYGIHHQFSAVVNGEGIPEVVFIRGGVPLQGRELMIQNFGRSVKDLRQLTRSPGNLTKSMGITMEHYGVDLTGDVLYLQEGSLDLGQVEVVTSERVGINDNLDGSDLKYRYSLQLGKGYLGDLVEQSKVTVG